MQFGLFKHGRIGRRQLALCLIEIRQKINRHGLESTVMWTELPRFEDEKNVPSCLLSHWKTYLNTILLSLHIENGGNGQVAHFSCLL